MEIRKDDAHKALYGERFLRLAEEGKRLPIMDAMRSLVRAYMQECGLSETWPRSIIAPPKGGRSISPPRIFRWRIKPAKIR